MKRFLLFVSVSAIIFLAYSCKKDQQKPDESILSGTWVKGAYAGDTLWIAEKNGLNILSYNASFNAALPAKAEMEYNYENEKLGIKKFMTDNKSFNTIPSFTWKVQGKEFEITAIELFSFVSSTNSKFVYRKIN